jgi:hypothetical protein
MSRYFIAWNSTKTEGFITVDKSGQDTAMTNKLNRSRGYPSRSTVAAAFFEAYEDEKKYRQTIEIDSDSTIPNPHGSSSQEL